MTDIIIPVGKSGFYGMELKYAIKSAQKHLSGIGEIHIMDGPDDTRLRHKEQNIYNKIRQGLERCESALVMHDDHFLLSDYKANKFPWYYQDARSDYRGHYNTTMQNTFEITGGQRDYDVHCPFNVTRAGFEKLGDLDWDKPFGYGIKTMYAHFNNVKGVKCEDLKINHPASIGEVQQLIQNRKWFSTGDVAFQGGVIAVLVKLFGK